MKGNHRQRIGRLAIGIALVSCLSAKGFAATETTTFPVTATVVQACTVSALPLVFGDYNPTSPTAKDATTTIEVACTIGTAFTTTLDAGTTTDGTFTQRRMAGAVSGGTL